jgi:TetR/AcrR family transcriptional repressor of nem operon
MSSRLRGPSDARLQIVRAAGVLFHRQGVECTTTDEVIETAGISKTEFRQHFKSKLILVRAVLDNYFEGLVAGVGPVNHELNSWDDLECCFASHLEFQKKFKMTRGCPVGMVGNGLKERDEATRQSLSHILDLMLARFASFFSREKVEGRLVNDADAEQLANFCVAVIQGAMLTGKIRGNCRCVESTFDDLLRHLKRYAKIPAVRRKRLARDRYPKQPTALAKASAPTTVVRLHGGQNHGDSVENRFVDLMPPVFEARKEIPDEGTQEN